MTKREFVELLTKKWPSGVVARREVSNFSGGLISPRSLANLDSQGNGPDGAIQIGANIAYSAAELAAWLYERTANMKIDTRLSWKVAKK